MYCQECNIKMWPIIIPHYSGVWLWECPGCKITYDLRTNLFTKSVESTANYPKE